ncbi:MAG: hypothetical protein Q4D71_08985 [Oscillospiraceae bacterium]|nr:hypothetical protein [Oscillospiraceae bacterium]
MATANMERSFWSTNPDWYRVNKNGKYELTSSAPPEAVESFRKWCIPRKDIKCPFKDLAPVE